MWFFEYYVSDSKMSDVKTNFPCSLGNVLSPSDKVFTHLFHSSLKTDLWYHSFGFMRKPGNCFEQKYFSPNENISGLNICFLHSGWFYKNSRKTEVCFSFKTKGKYFTKWFFFFVQLCKVSNGKYKWRNYNKVWMLNLERFCRNNDIVTYRWVKYELIFTKYKSQKAQEQKSCSLPEL